MNGAMTFTFGSFVFIPRRQLLLHGDAVVRVGCRALDLLLALVEQPGELVTKHELIARAWPTTTVCESNLKVNIGALRRALDDDVGGGAAKYIATVSGRGYRFVAPVKANGQPVPRLQDAAAHDGFDPVAQLAQAARMRLADLLDEATPLFGGLVGDNTAEVVIGGELVLRLDSMVLRVKLGG